MDILDNLYIDFLEFTKEEIQELFPLLDKIDKLAETLTALLDEMITANEENMPVLIAKVIKTRSQLTKSNTRLIEINKAAEDRYIQKEATEQEIINDAKFALSQATKEAYENYVSTQQEKDTSRLTQFQEFLRNHKELESDNLLEAYSENYPPTSNVTNWAGYSKFLLAAARLQLLALNYHDYTKNGNNPIVELIEAQASEAYEPPEEPPELYPEQAAKPGEILTAKQELDIIRTSRPENYLSINDTVSNLLFNPERQSEAYTRQLAIKNDSGQLIFKDLEIKVGSKNKQEVTSLVSICYDNDNITFTQNGKPVGLDDYDRAVFNGIITIYLNGGTGFTLPVLYAAITGKSNSDIKITDDIRKWLLKALKKLKKVEVELDFSNEQELYTFKDESGNTLTLHSFKETVLNLGEGEFILNGQKVKGYVINSKPKLLSYAQAKKQIVTTPYKALELKIGEKNTPEVIALRQFLIDEIARINNPKQNNSITYQAIYSRIAYVKGIDELTKKQKISTRSSALMILNNFVASEYIKGYEEKTKGRAYHHIEITPSKTMDS